MKSGSVVEAEWAIYANHGGGYRWAPYRPTDRPLNILLLILLLLIVTLIIQLILLLEYPLNYPSFNITLSANSYRLCKTVEGQAPTEECYQKTPLNFATAEVRYNGHTTHTTVHTTGGA